MQYFSFITIALLAALQAHTSIPLSLANNGVLPSNFQPRIAIDVGWNATSAINGTLASTTASPGGIVSDINSLTATASNMVFTSEFAPPSASASRVVSSTTSSTMITSTLNSPPAAMSTEHATHTEWSKNTWFTTVHNGHSTIVPVLVGCPTCGGLGGGIIVWDFPTVPDVSFQFPEFPDLPSFHLPCIEIFGVPVTGDCGIPPANDNGGNPGPPNPSPTPSNKPTETNSETRSTTTSPSLSSPASLSSSSSSTSSPDESCPSSATKTASDCNVFCTSATGMITQGCATTCSSTRVGCNAMGITSTSSSRRSCVASTSSGVFNRRNDGNDDCADCPSPLPEAPLDGPLAVTLPPIDPDDLERRNIAGRVVHVFDKRDNEKTVSSINGCTLTTPQAISVTIPAYPGGSGFWQSDNAGNLRQEYSAISRYYVATQIGCRDIVTRKDAINWKVQQQSSDHNIVASLDHAYEIGWLNSFMTSIINNDLSCADTNAIFFDLNCDPPVNYMKLIYDNLASNAKLDFVAMSLYLNQRAKGRILATSYKPPGSLLTKNKVGPTWPWKKAMQNIDKKLDTLNILTLGCLTVNVPTLIDLIQKTNNRLYYSFQLIDARLAATPGLPRQGFNFANKYKAFMNDKAASWNSVPMFVIDLIRNIEEDLQTAGHLVDLDHTEWNKLNSRWQEYDSNYGSINSPTAYNIVLNWMPDPSKRDLEVIERLIKRDGICSRPDSSSSAIVEPSSSVSLSASASSGTVSSTTLESSISQPATPGSGIFSFATASVTPSSSIAQSSSPVTRSHSTVSASVGSLTASSPSLPQFTSCKLAQTTFTGSIAPGPQTYCDCGDSIVGINTITQSGTVYSVCAAPPFSTIASSILPESSFTTPPPSPTTGFVMTATTLSCGGKFGWGSAVPTTVPRDQTNYVLDAIIHFCTPKELHDGILKLRQGEFAYQRYRIPGSKYGVFLIMLLWDPRPECSAIPAPEFRVALSGGPDPLCKQFLDTITNTCDAQDGQNKHGGTLEINCVYYGWRAFDANTVRGTGKFYEAGYHFASEIDGWTIGNSSLG